MKNKQVTMTKKLINLLLKREREKNEDIARTSESAKGLLFRASESVKSTHPNESDIIYRDFAPTPTAILDAMFHSTHTISTSAVPTHTRRRWHINESTPTPCVRQCFARITPQLFCHLFVSATHTHKEHFQSEQREWEGDRSPSITNTIVREETIQTSDQFCPWAAWGSKTGRGTGNHRNPSHTHTHTPTTSWMTPSMITTISLFLLTRTE